MNEASAPLPKSSPMRAGPMPSVAARNSGSTGSSIDMVADAAITASVQTATGGDLRTTPIGTGSVSARGDGMSSQRKPAAPSAASPATVRNGARMPPAS